MAAVIYLDRNRFQWFGSNITTILSSEFAPTTVNDLELLNEEELEKHIASFVESNKISPTSIIMVLAPAIYFEKDIPSELKPDEQEEATNKFISNVPFSQSSFKSYPFDKTTKVIAANGALIDCMKGAFAKAKCTIITVVPAFAIESQIPISTGFNEETAKKLVKKVDSFKPLSLEVRQIEVHSESSEINFTTTDIEQPKNNKRLYMLVGFFVFSLIVLAIFYFYSQSTQSIPPPAQTKQEPSPVETVPTKPSSASAELSPTVDPTQLSDIRIQILNGSGIVGQADVIRRRLVTAGFSSIETGNAGNVNVSKTLIIFTAETPTAIRNLIIEEVRKDLPDVSAQETNDAPFDVQITTGRTVSPTP